MGDGIAAVAVDGLSKTYVSRTVVRNVSFLVRAGEIYGLLGPNGAGKTTLIEMIQGLRRPTAGRALVLGMDPERDGRALRQRTGTCLQHTRFPPRLKVREVGALFASAYTRPADPDETLRRFGLWEHRRTYCQNLSGGEAQRLAVALAFIGNPDVVFLDEPSAGLDAATRHALYSTLRGLRDRGCAVLLTTHYFEEASDLCDRLAILHAGEIAANGSLGQLRAEIRPETTIRVRWQGRGRDPIPALPPDAAFELDADSGGARITTVERARAVTAVVRWCEAMGLELIDIEISQASLEEIFQQALSNRSPTAQ